MPSGGDRSISIESVRRLMEDAWRDDGYTSPNPQTYPWLWLWDSCFHAVIWTALGDDRAITELQSLFGLQTDDGFVAHVGYVGDPAAAMALWGQRGTSTITQPPMYGHAIRTMADAGLDVPDELIEAARRGLHHLTRTRRRSGPLLVIVHPWESGCDDSVRWGSWMPDPFSKPAWDDVKRKLVDVASVRGGGAFASPEFEVPSVAFNALVAFNARELAAVSGDDTLLTIADDIVGGLEANWSVADATWADGAHDSATAPTLEALLPLLVTDDSMNEAWAAVVDPSRFGAPYGPRQTPRQHAEYDPDAYWRGPSWPQLNYLLWLAAVRADRAEIADRLANTSIRGASSSGLAEYWNPETGEGRGAVPQSWSALAWVMQEAS